MNKKLESYAYNFWIGVIVTIQAVMYYFMMTFQRGVGIILPISGVLYSSVSALFYCMGALLMVSNAPHVPANISSVIFKLEIPVSFVLQVIFLGTIYI